MTGKRGRPTAAERLARQERVERAIVALLTTEGWDAVTFDRIAAESRVAKRTLYADFGDRLGLLRAAVRRQHGTLAQLPASASLREAAIALVSQLLSDKAIGIHRAIVAAAPHAQEAGEAIAAEFYEAGPHATQRLLAAHVTTRTPPSGGASATANPSGDAFAEALSPRAPAADILFTALLGEPHRRRLLGLDAAPTPNAVAAHVDRVLQALGLDPTPKPEPDPAATR